MRKRKFAALVTAAAMVFGIGTAFPSESNGILRGITASADGAAKLEHTEYTADAQGSFSFVTSSDTLKPGDTFTTELRIDKNPGINSFNVEIGYNKEVFQVTSVNMSSTMFASSSCAVDWSNKSNQPFIVTWVDAAAQNSGGGIRSFSDTGTLLTLNMKVRDDAAPGSYDFDVSFDPDNMFRTEYSSSSGYTLENVPFTGTGCSVDIISQSLSKPISGSMITVSPTTYTYDGTAKRPTVTVKDGAKTLVSGTDYTVTYSNNIKAGTATASVTGMGDYTGTAAKEYTINPRTLTSSMITISPTTYTYDGAAKRPTVTVKYGTRTLLNNTDYTVSYVNNTEPGTASAIVNGTGNFTGTVTLDFSIGTKALTSSMITVSPTSYTYDGTAKRPTVTVKDGTKTLVSGTDYTVTYSNNTDAGTYAAVTVTGKGNYSGAVTSYFTISGKALTSSMMTVSPTTYTYDGTAKRPTVTVKDGTKTLVSGTDYTVTYSNNTDAGTYAAVTVTGKGNYSGTVTSYFTISGKALTSSMITVSPTAYTYDGTAKRPTVTVKDGTKTLVSGTDYTVTYSNNTMPGTASVTVTGKGNYTGTVKTEFTILAGDAVIYGDVNRDGAVNFSDLGLLQQYLCDWDVQIDFTAADVAYDGNINFSDLGLLQQYLCDWDVTLGKKV